MNFCRYVYTRGHSPCQCYIPRFDPVCSDCGWAPTKGPGPASAWHRLERSLVSAIHIYEAGTVVFAPTHSAQLCVGKILTLGLGQLGSKCPLSMPRLVSPQLLCSNGAVPLGPRLSFQPTTGKNMASRFFTLAKLFLEMSRQMIGGLQEMQGRNGFGEISTQSHAAEILNYRKWLFS